MKKTCPRCRRRNLPTKAFGTNRKSCKKCLAWAAEYYATRKRTNVCVSCGGSSKNRRGPLCKECAKTRCASKATARARGLCGHCRFNKPMPNRKLCECCAAYFVEHRRSRPVERLFASAKFRAKRDGIRFTIKVSDVELPTHCPIFGIKIDSYAGGRFSAPSLDRVIPKLGYIPGNVQIISWRANVIKNDGSAEEHDAVARYIRKCLKRALSTGRRPQLGFAGANR